MATSNAPVRMEWDALNPAHAKWNQLDGHAKEAASVLGYDKDSWDPENWGEGKIVVPLLVKERDWNELHPTQRDAAKVVGLSSEKWTKLHAMVH